MSLTRRLTELEAEHAELDLLARKTLAKLRGVEAEMEAIRAGVNAPVRFGAIATRTEAILAVLRSADRSLTPSEVTSRLAASGRATDDLKAVTTTMSYLNQRGRIQKVDGSHYFAL